MNIRPMVRGIAAASAVAALGAAAVIAGPLNPPAGPISPTYKTLTEVEPRTAVNQLAGNGVAKHVIAQAGTYYLTADVVGASGDHGIQVAADDVVIDLMGFTLMGGPGTADGIDLSGPRRNVTVRNGVIRAWGGRGIDGADDANVRLEGLTISLCGSDGALLEEQAVVQSCIATHNGGRGLAGDEGSVFLSCAVASNVGAGLQVLGGGSTNQGGGLVSHCTSMRNESNGIVVSNATVQSCVASYNSGSGIVAANSTVEACTTRANAAHGISAGNAMVIGCTSRGNSLAGINGGEAVLIVDCLSRANVGDGIRIDKECTVRDTHSDCNGFGAGGAAGIRATGPDNRIEGNMVTDNFNTGIKVDVGGTIILANRARAHATNYDLAVGNCVGTIVNSQTALNNAANALINISF